MVYGPMCLHAEVLFLTLGYFTVPARRCGSLIRLFHGVYPEQNNKILSLHFVQGQKDKKRRVCNDHLLHINRFKAFTIGHNDHMKRLGDLNFYELLEVAFDASPLEIHHAYKEMYELYHEDSLASYSFFPREEREEILTKLDEAYSTLIDEKKRSHYDQSLMERGILEEEMQHQRDQKTLSLVSNSERSNNNTTLRIRNRLKTVVSSNPTIQEILTQDVLSGKDLKKIRDELGVSLEMIAEMVKVRIAYLHAIEDDQFEKMPSRVFLKGFLKAYAECIGLDADIVVSRYLKRVND
jgi:hypothetical protein